MSSNLDQGPQSSRVLAALSTIFREMNMPLPDEKMQCPRLILGDNQ
ncbi:unnamed protein product [Penicillium camemberti]|uniref:Str. FM013 n=1 Tax=Penicillium camemberti (strain FM 013) TaxID=1429867 RepID=A0A0G4P6N3_PENC3|nr:unnamed protein product [Penicillium camemberti]